jgi:hypothetical protein
MQVPGSLPVQMHEMLLDFVLLTTKRRARTEHNAGAWRLADPSA